LLILSGTACMAQPYPDWLITYADTALPGDGYGTAGFAFRDFDRDGDLDITVSRRTGGGEVFFYRNDSMQWSRHFIGIADLDQLGAADADVDRDGWPDLIMGRYWFQNPAESTTNNPGQWTRHSYNGGLVAENHDVIVADLDLDGLPEIIAYSQRDSGGTIRIYSTADPYNWEYTDITRTANKTAMHIDGSNGLHGGFAPAGTGDLNGDRYPDVIMPTGWYQNPGNFNSMWVFHPWPFEIGRVPNLYGLSIRSWVTDLDGDHDNDWVYTDCDVEFSGAYWVENLNQGSQWIRHSLPMPGAVSGSLHSLVIADFNHDGLPDVFSGEQEDNDRGMKPAGLRERGIIWYGRQDSSRLSFTPVVIHADNPGWHDTLAGDVDSDGDIDLATKVWHKDGKHYHLTLWINRYFDSQTLPGPIK